MTGSSMENIGKDAPVRRWNARRLATLCLAMAAAGLLGGCATSGNPKDPIEGFNRAMFAFNDGLDKAVVKPVAKGYEAVLPQPARNGVANFFSNIGDVFIAVNDLLQGKVPDAINDTGRVLVNSTLGVLGFMDVATELGVPKRTEDFGLTLARWGVGNGPYVVLPFFGGRTTRDAFGLVLDLKADPVSNIANIPSRNTLVATRILSDRVQLFPADKIVDEAALDRYSYIRDAYLQHRRSLIYDGNPPREDDHGAAAEPVGKTPDVAAVEAPAANAEAEQPRLLPQPVMAVAEAAPPKTEARR